MSFRSLAIEKGKLTVIWPPERMEMEEAHKVVQDLRGAFPPGEGYRVVFLPDPAMKIEQLDDDLLRQLGFARITE